MRRRAKASPANGRDPDFVLGFVMDGLRHAGAHTDWRPTARRVAAGLCWGYAAACLLGFLLIHFVAEHWWPATFLLFAPRWIWIAPLPLVVAAAIAFTRRLAWLPIATGVLSLFGLLGLSIPWRTWRSPPAARVSLRILTCNGHARQMSAATVDQLISEYKPDICAFQDFWPRRMPQSFRQPGWFLRRDEELVIASRFPIRGSHDLGLAALAPEDPRLYAPTRHGMAACFTIELPTGPITFVDLHLASAHEGLSAMGEDAQLSGSLLSRNSRRRAAESQAIRRQIDAIGGPVLLAGDFNTPDDSPLFRSAWSGLNDAFTNAGFGFGITYARHGTALRIDHVLCDPTWTLRACRVGPDVGSGHHALVVDLQR